VIVLGKITMQNVDVEYAGFWVRVGAAIIDSSIIILLILPLQVAIYGLAYFDVGDSFFKGPADILVYLVAPAIVVIAFWMHKQATPGKLALSVRVVDATTGSPLSANQCVGRYLAYFVSIIPFAVGFFWIAFDKRKQGWHDKLAGTIVIRGKTPSIVWRQL
jgi:uncharacterized RDD family membrane protein YckC